MEILMIAQKLVRNFEGAADFLSVLGNGKRLQIMSHLLTGELSVGAIAERVSLSQSALSQHLAKLRSARLVETRRDRQMIYYSCRSTAVVSLLQTLDCIFGDNTGCADDSQSAAGPFGRADDSLIC
jgi:ArsR family transcriptional regulator, virulence genes transcriptional regulator